MPVAPVAAKMRVAAPKPNIALRPAQRGDKPPQREAIEVPLHGDADAAGNFHIRRCGLEKLETDIWCWRQKPRMLCPLCSKVETKAATAAELRRRRTIGEEMTDGFMPPVNHLHSPMKRWLCPERYN